MSVFHRIACSFGGHAVTLIDWTGERKVKMVRNAAGPSPFASWLGCGVRKCFLYNDGTLGNGAYVKRWEPLPWGRFEPSNAPPPPFSASQISSYQAAILSAARQQAMSMGANYGQYWQSGQTLYSSSGSLTNSGPGALPTFAETVRARSEAQYRSIKNTGIEVGETIAWRCWRVKGGLCWSVTQNVAWPAREPISGDVVEVGIFAFKSAQDALNEYGVDTCWRDENGGDGMVLGQVALWGEIVEHENGYRASFGRVYALQTVYPANPVMLDNLRKTYGVP